MVCLCFTANLTFIIVFLNQKYNNESKIRSEALLKIRQMVLSASQSVKGHVLSENLRDLYLKYYLAYHLCLIFYLA